MKPKYSELVKALDTLRKWTDYSLLNACSAKEIRDSYAELQRASVRAGPTGGTCGAS
jgi:hypothetical protein